MKTELTKNVEKTKRAKWSGTYPWESDDKTDNTDNILKDSYEKEGTEKNTEDSTETSGD